MPRKNKKPKAEKECPVVDGMLVSETVENPLYHPVERPQQPLQIEATRSLRDDLLGLMFARRQIRRGHLDAGRRFQRTVEAAGNRLKSPGDIQEPVDGSPHHRDGITDRQRVAMLKLIGYRQLLGTACYALVESVAIHQHSLREIVEDGNKMPSQALTRETGGALRFALGRLARAMGLATE